MNPISTGDWHQCPQLQTKQKAEGTARGRDKSTVEAREWIVPLGGW